MPSVVFTPGPSGGSAPVYSPYSPQVAIASLNGAVQDCNLATGASNTGGTATDNGPVMSSLAQAGPDEILLDGPSSMSGLFLLAAGTTILRGLGPTTGIYARSGMNNSVIQNAPIGTHATWDVGPGTPPARGGTIGIENFYLNCNYANISSSGDPRTTPGMPEGFVAGIDLSNLTEARIKDLVIYEQPTYATLFRNVGRILIDNLQVLRAAGDRPYNTDGIHADGTFDELVASNCRIQSGDDSIAINLPEGNSGNAGRVLINNFTFDQCISMTRIYTTNGSLAYSIASVEFSNCVGTFLQECMILGLWTPIGFIGGAGAGPAKSIGVARFTNIDATGSIYYCPISANIGLLEVANHTWRLNQTATSRGYVTEFRAFSVAYGANIDTMRVDGFTVIDTASYGPIPRFLTMNDAGYSGSGATSGTIRHLIIDSLDMDNITAFCDDFTKITTISGAGVLATGKEFPDSVMANGTPYLSATSHLPSIKIGGVVKTYTVT